MPSAALGVIIILINSSRMRSSEIYKIFFALLFKEFQVFFSMVKDNSVANLTALINL